MANVSRNRAAFWGTVSQQAYTIIGMLVSIVSTPLMVRYLDKEAYGLSILFFQIINYLAMFDFGLSTAVNRNLALHRGDDENNRAMVNRIMSTGVLMSVGFAVLVTLIGVVVAPFLPSLYKLRPDLAAPAVPIVMTLSLMVGGQFVQRGLAGIFYAHHRQPLIGTPLFIVSMIGSGLTILLLSRGVGLWTFVYVNIFQFFANLLVQIFLLRRYYPHLRIRRSLFDKTLGSSMMTFGFFMFLHGLATQIILFTDRLVIGKVLTLALVTIFSITVRIPEVGMSLLGIVLSNALPAVAEIVVQEGDESTRYHFRRMMVLMASLSALCFWIMLILDKWFITLWVGADFFASTWILVLALIIMMQQTITRTGHFFLDAKGIVRNSSFAALIEAALNITLSVLLGYKIGMPGILLGTILASTVTSTWYVPYLLRKHLKISFYQYFVQSLARPLTGIGLVGGGIYLLMQQLTTFIRVTWLTFFGIAGVLALVLGLFVWIVYLRGPLGQYIPVRFRKALFVPPFPTIPA
jgi:O-antigen/teichoic acid export membrane protein